jgi:hypothetical protein
MKFLGFGQERLPSVIKDPFSKNQVERISVTFWRSPFMPRDWEAYGSVEFKNGETTGEQKFKGQTFDEVVVKIKAMLETL